MKSQDSYGAAFAANFMGNASIRYKQTIIAFLILNPLLLILSGPVLCSWALIGEFILTLVMALKCYPLQPGGLLAMEAVLLGLTQPQQVYEETLANLPVILLLLFMVTGIYFLRPMLLFVFTKLLIRVRNKITLALMFCLMGAVLSAFFNALTVAPILIGVCVGFYQVYHKVISQLGYSAVTQGAESWAETIKSELIREHAAKAGEGEEADEEHDYTDDNRVQNHRRQELEDFRGFLRNLLMYGVVGTALGGVFTLVGEPQNLLVGEKLGWGYTDFLLNMLPVALPTLIAGLLTVILVEKLGLFGYGIKLPESVFQILNSYQQHKDKQRNRFETAAIYTQLLGVVFLVICVALNVAEAGLVGLAMAIIVTSGVGITDEHKVGHAFSESMPFTALLVVFFVIVSIIHEQHLFDPMLQLVLAQDLAVQPAMLFLASGGLALISDNVFVATAYITEVSEVFKAGLISREHFETLALAINSGTNLTSIGTPNGQAAFLFVLTSAFAPLVRLSYLQMVKMGFPFAVVLTLVGLVANLYWV